MGKVFTWIQVEGDYIPKPANFSKVVESLHRVLPVEPSITDAMICGSVARKEFTCRSDIDCVVVYDSFKRRQALHVMGELSRWADALHVPLNFIPCSTAVRGTRMHHLSPSFLEHLKATATAGFLKGRPLEGWAQSVTRQEGVEEYLRFKLHKLEARWAEYPAMDELSQARFLQKCLEAPIHVARRTLAWFGPLSGDSKIAIQKQYRDAMPQALYMQLSGLLVLDGQYSEELQQQLESPSHANYYLMLELIQQRAPEVIEFVSANIEHLNNVARP